MSRKISLSKSSTGRGVWFRGGMLCVVLVLLAAVLVSDNTAVAPTVTPRGWGPPLPFRVYSDHAAFHHNYANDRLWSDALI